jgi:hypothetical protein
MMDRMYCLILSIMAILLKNSYRELADDNAIFNLIQIKFGSTVPGIDCDRLQRAYYDSSTLWPLGPALFANYPRPRHYPPTPWRRDTEPIHRLRLCQHCHR